MIKDLEARQGNVDIVVEVMEVSEAKEFEKFGKQGKVANAMVKDESGEIKLTLWNDDIDKIKVGDKIHIINGYVGEWQGEKQLSTGKFGQMEVVKE
ncbi:MAG: OB-fold nucleic acid binding domain-containing protein [Candidatus Woesearchaeota archaeon]|jgi:replication factor A1|nr:OB-fold nucleic acid binding domain-containing protein [Candidatus Woesearchaeota archaeon]MDP7610204.1 OB-fold nucleic acid binding domain-containing protein [Candidatus Woesearchaeota archaeon]